VQRATSYKEEILVFFNVLSITLGILGRRYVKAVGVNVNSVLMQIHAHSVILVPL
jgi:hypothetical protein